jgi:hypothetical protein
MSLEGYYMSLEGYYHELDPNDRLKADGTPETHNTVASGVHPPQHDERYQGIPIVCRKRRTDLHELPLIFLRPSEL